MSVLDLASHAICTWDGVLAGYDYDDLALVTLMRSIAVPNPDGHFIRPFAGMTFEIVGEEVCHGTV